MPADDSSAIASREGPGASPAKREGSEGVQAILGGLHCPHSVTRSMFARPASVGRPQHSHVAGRTQLMTLLPRAGCTALSVWLVRFRCPPRPAVRIPGNGTTTLIEIPPVFVVLQCLCQKPEGGD